MAGAFSQSGGDALDGMAVRLVATEQHKDPDTFKTQTLSARFKSAAAPTSLSVLCLDRLNCDVLISLKCLSDPAFGALCRHNR